MKPLLISGYACDGSLHSIDIYFQPEICDQVLVSCRLLSDFVIVELFKNSS